MPTLLEYLSRPDPFAGLFLGPILQWWDRPVDGAQLHAAVSPSAFGPILSGTARPRLPSVREVDAECVADLVPNPSSGPGDAGAFVYGIGLFDATRCLVFDHFDQPIAAGAGARWRVRFQVSVLATEDGLA